MHVHDAKGDVCPRVATTLSLRPYQLEALAEVERRKGAGARVLVVSPTGSGKTVLAAEFIARALAREQRVLFVAHRREIINQTYDKLQVAGLAANQVGIVMAGDPRRRSCAPVQVASIDTLRCRSKPWADIVIVDEAHRAMAKSYRDLAAGYPGAFHVGLTATPDRADGQGLADAYDDLIVVTTPAALMKEGFLVMPRCFTVPKERGPDLSAVGMKGGDFDERALAAVMNRTELVGDIVAHWKKRAEGRRTVAFAVDIAHSMQIADRFNKAGIRAEHLDGSTSKEERDAILARLNRGETRVVSNCNVLVEGWDQPAVKCAILARPTASSTLYLQQAGRILRPWTDPTTGETPTAILLDHAACIAMHGLPQDERDYQLAAPKKRGRPSLGPTRECPACGCVIPLGARECPTCHEELPVSEPGGVVETEGELVEVVPEDPALRAEKLAEWRRLLEVQRVCSCKRGWAHHKYREKYNEAPPRVTSNAETPEAKAAFLDEMRSMCARRGYDPDFAATRYRERFGEAPPEGWDTPLAEAANDNASELGARASGDWFF